MSNFSIQVGEHSGKRGVDDLVEFVEKYLHPTEKDTKEDDDEESSKE